MLDKLLNVLPGCLLDLVILCLVWRKYWQEWSDQVGYQERWLDGE